ncbi:MAG: M23 family metallopeptidase [Candidatus Paceibacterota bacterium]
MNIKLQLKNFAKLLLIGVVLYVVFSAASKEAVRCVSAKSNDACQADLAKNMFAQSDEQVKPESPNYLMVGDACVKAAVPPIAVTPKVMGAIIGDAQDYEMDAKSPRTIVEYQVEEKDTVASLAAKFDISSDTIIWANDLAKGAQPKPGQRLIIPPVTGIIHYVVSGDTIAKISQDYNAKPDDVVAFNELSGENDVFVGDVLVVPGGRVPQIVIAPKPSSTISNAKPQKLEAQSLAAMPPDYFLCPVGSACKRTQGSHFRNAVDLTGGYCGAPIYAAASGTIAKAKLGWNGGAGNNISISHMGGTVITHYYHLQTMLVAQGQEVKKGDVIGLMGATGKSTGCHLHFEVIGASNPFVR